jgi:hypothetical protein
MKHAEKSPSESLTGCRDIQGKILNFRMAVGSWELLALLT